MHHVKVACLLAALSLGALGGSAQAARRGPWFAHDPGFFMRLSGGIGYGSASLQQDSDTGFRGVAGQGSFAFGGTVTRNLAVHADLFGLNMFEPTVEVDGVDQGNAQNTTTSLGAIGIGVTGYVMPANLYFSGSIGAGVGTVKTRAQFLGGVITLKEDTDPGLAVNLMVGKEWFVSPRWGLGVALQAMFASLSTKDNGDDLSVFGIGVLFSATLN